MKPKNTTQNTHSNLETQLFKAADKLRKNIDAAEYKHIVLGLIFLRFVSLSFETLYAIVEKEYKDGASTLKPDDKDHYIAESILYLPQEARWQYLRSRAKLPSIGTDLDKAMERIEAENTSLLQRGTLPQVYARQNIDTLSLGGLIDLINNIDLHPAMKKEQYSHANLNTLLKPATDMLGRVYEYFLGEFALAEGKKGGQFYTPKSIVNLLVEMIEPYHGQVYDPCCGSGGMFIMSERFVKEHQESMKDISIWGQESNQTTYRLARMNLAIRRIESDNIRWNKEGSFLNDEHRDLKADYILANPPFNDSDWSGERLRDDIRWKYGTPPVTNANFAWVQHFVHHLSPKGVAGFVLAKGALTSKTGGEDSIRKHLVQENLVDCIVNLPAKLFLNTQIPASLWFLSRKRDGYNGDRARANEILFIDARDKGHLINRRTRELSPEDIHTIASTYHNWRKANGKYADIKGFCCAASVQKVADLDYILTPGRYVGLPEEEDDFNFAERFSTLQKEWEAQVQEEAQLNQRIARNLNNIIVP